MTSDNTTKDLNDYISLLDLYFRKEDTTYDIYFYESEYFVNYDKYLLDLGKLIPEEYVEKFDSDIIQDKCIENGKLIGLVMTFIIYIYI